MCFTLFCCFQRQMCFTFFFVYFRGKCVLLFFVAFRGKCVLLVFFTFRGKCVLLFFPGHWSLVQNCKNKLAIFFVQKWLFAVKICFFLFIWAKVSKMDEPPGPTRPLVTENPGPRIPPIKKLWRTPKLKRLGNYVIHYISYYIISYDIVLYFTRGPSCKMHEDETTRKNNEKETTRERFRNPFRNFFVLKETTRWSDQHDVPEWGNVINQRKRLRLRGNLGRVGGEFGEPAW